MAKKRNRSSQRDVSTIASSSAVYRNVSRPVLLSDRREFHPLGDVAPVYSPRKSQRKIVEKKVVTQPNRNKVGRARKQKAYYKISFGVPRKVELCVRRKQRREVMFAMRRTGKGSRAVRRRRNYWSGVSCK